MDAQNSDPLCKEDTIVRVATPSLTVDNSQFATNLTASALAVYETSSARAAITGATGRELYLRVSVQTTDKNTVMLIHANTANIANHTYLIKLDAFADMVFSQNDIVLYTLTPALAGTSSLSIHWSTRPNPDTTGAGDAVISEFLVYNHTTSAYIGEVVQVAHAISTTSASWALGIGGYWNGALLAASGQVSKCRIGTAWHPANEMAEEWISMRAAPTADANALEYLLPLTVASGIGDDGEWAGQANFAWIAEDNARKRRALWSPLVNTVWSDAEAFAKTPDDPVPWVRLAPGSALYEMRIDWLRWLAVPAGCTHARVWVQVVSYVTSSTAVPIKLRLYAMNRTEELDPNKYPGAPKFAYAYCESALHTVNDTVSGVGQWLSLGRVQLPTYTEATTGFAGTVHLCLAYAFDPASTSGNDANARIKIRAAHCVPVFKPVPNNLGE
jgi:hypothetical protein